jgi:outer membrane protein OmpA-like peptidoglycan-associated protein
VHGHTDSVGTPQANLALSRARADAVATAIRGARPDLALDVQGFGEDRPVAPNERGGEDDPAGRAQNRRVELRFTG